MNPEWVNEFKDYQQLLCFSDFLSLGPATVQNSGALHPFAPLTPPQDLPHGPEVPTDLPKHAVKVLPL